MDGPAISAKQSAYTSFENWLCKQPYWIQDAAWRIYHGMTIDDKKINEYADFCVLQIKGETVNFKRLEKKDIEKTAEASSLALIRIYELSGVNAIAKNASLDFSSEGVTVVYGLNGAGKSGYMRALKQVSGNPFEEPIQPNVFKKGEQTTPSCKIVVIDNQQEKEIYCDLSYKSDNVCLLGCDVFDTKISNQYITGTNNASYQPFVFTVLSELSIIAGKINKVIEERISAIRDRSIEIPNEYDSLEDTGWLKNLTFDTNIPDDYQVWSSEQDNLLNSIPAMLDSEKMNQQIDTISIQLKTLSPLIDDLNNADTLLADELIVKYDTYISCKEKYNAAELLFSENADEIDKASVSVTAWKSLWACAKEYYDIFLHENGNIEMGEGEMICPLCHQTISGDYLSRFNNVNDYVNGTCSEEYQQAAKDLGNSLSRFCNRMYNSETVKAHFSECLTEEECKSVEIVFQTIESIKAIKELEAAFCKCNNLNLRNLTNMLSQKKSDLESKKNDLINVLRSEEQQSKRNQLKKLQWVKWVYDRQDDISKIIENLKKIHTLTKAKALLTTNKITSESNRLASALISEAYVERFTNELNKLAPNLQVRLEKAQSKKGNTPYKVSIDTETGTKCKLEDILSEGEQRIVALATFFADATGGNIHTPLIIDDPISSLDYNYEDAATKRIVELAKERQVIVFTHRISLLKGIHECCDQSDVRCNEKYIRGGVKGKGLPDVETEYHGSAKKQLNALLNKIKEIRKMDPDSEGYQDAVGRVCQKYRTCIEHAVEDDLLFGIVTRFNRRIKTMNLVQKLALITSDDCNMIDKMMSKYSFMEHSQPSETPEQLFALDEIERDIEIFRDWIIDYNSRTK